MAKVPDTQENLEKCACRGCPTHDQCMKDKMEGLFCARGKSTCKVKRSGCFCGNCTVASDHKLDGMYYCEQGAAE